MDNKTLQVLEWLSDEESRNIFKARLEFEKTYDYSAIQSIIDQYAPLYAGKKWIYVPDELKRVIEQYEEVIVAGAGVRGKALIRMLLKEGVKVKCAVDSFMEGSIHYDFGSVNVIKMDSLGSFDGCIIISVFENSIAEQIGSKLVANGIKEDHIYLLNDYVYPMLAEDFYFDDKLIQYEMEEVFVDCGACQMETSIRFIRECPGHGVKCSAVYAFEPDFTNYQKCLENATELGMFGIKTEVVNAGAWSEDSKISFDSGKGEASKISDNGNDSIRTVSLDSYIKGKVSFIKMDIEGAELEALHGAKGIIQKYHPKLAICVYHKSNDITDIPIYIKEIVPEYRFYLRHYSNSTAQTVLYAVI